MVEQQVNMLPEVEMQLSWLPSDVKYYASYDCLSGFDMLRVEPEATKCFGISTIFRCFRLVGAPMGFCNTPTVFKERLCREILGGVEEGGLFGRP